MAKILRKVHSGTRHQSLRKRGHLYCVVSSIVGKSPANWLDMSTRSDLFGFLYLPLPPTTFPGIQAVAPPPPDLREEKSELFQEGPQGKGGVPFFSGVDGKRGCHMVVSTLIF